MAGLPYQAWERFAIWLAAGLVMYFLYGYSHSRLRSQGPGAGRQGPGGPHAAGR